MKKIALVLIFAFFTGLQALAQEKHHRAENPEVAAREMTKRMSEKLDLSDEQFEQLYEANLEMAEARQQRHEEKRELQKRHDQRLEDILNEEQYQRYQKQKVHRMKKMEKRHDKKSEHHERMKQKRETDSPRMEREE